MSMSSEERSCYKLIAQAVLQRDARCRFPGCGRLSEAPHHLFPRARHATAFLPKAIWGCCNEHHRWFHAHPIECRNIAIKTMGQDRYYELQRLSYTVVKNVNFKDIREKLKKLLEE